MSGTQGVLIPGANIVHLMLRQDVLDAVDTGTFHIYAADNIDTALELLTGYTAQSIDEAVLARVEELHELSRQFSKSGDDQNGDNGDGKQDE